MKRPKIMALLLSAVMILSLLPSFAVAEVLRIGSSIGGGIGGGNVETPTMDSGLEGTLDLEFFAGQTIHLNDDQLIDELLSSGKYYGFGEKMEDGWTGELTDANPYIGHDGDISSGFTTSDFGDSDLWIKAPMTDAEDFFTLWLNPREEDYYGQHFVNINVSVRFPEATVVAHNVDEVSPEEAELMQNIGGGFIHAIEGNDGIELIEMPGYYNLSTAAKDIFIFTATDAGDDDLTAAYGNTFYCDFVVSFDEDVKADSVILTGSYGTMTFSILLGRDFTANKTKQFLITSLPVPFLFDYSAILNVVDTFLCTAINIDEANIGTTVNVSLVMWPVDGNKDTDCVTITTIPYTFTESNLSAVKVGETPYRHVASGLDSQGYVINGFDFVSQGNVPGPHFAPVRETVNDDVTVVVDQNPVTESGVTTSTEQVKVNNEDVATVATTGVEVNANNVNVEDVVEKLAEGGHIKEGDNIVLFTLDKKTEGAENNTITYEVTPKLTVNGFTTEVTNDQLSGDVTFRLDVKGIVSNVGDKVIAQHKSGSTVYGTEIYEAEADGDDLYIEITTRSFSEWNLAPVEDNAVAAIYRSGAYVSSHTTLAAAFAAVQNNETIELLANVTLTERLFVNAGANPAYGGTNNRYATTSENKSITLDLNEHYIASASNIALAGGSLNITGTGTISTSNAGLAPIEVHGRGDLNSKRTLTIGANVVLQGVYGLNIFGSNDGQKNKIDVTVNGTVNGILFVLGNLTNTANEINIVVNGTVAAPAGPEDKPNVGIALNGYANVTVNNGAAISGDSGIEVRAGNLTVNGGTITATANEYSFKPNGSGTTSKGVGIAVAQHTTEKDIQVNISGGDISGKAALALANPQTNDEGEVNVSVTGGTFTGTGEQAVAVFLDESETRVNGFISGGSFSSVVADDYCATGYEPVTTAVNGMYTVKEEEAYEPQNSPYSSHNGYLTNFVDCTFANVQDSIYMNVVLYINTGYDSDDDDKVTNGSVHFTFMGINQTVALSAFHPEENLDAASALALATDGYYCYKTGNVYIVRIKVFPYQISQKITVQLLDGGNVVNLYQNTGNTSLFTSDGNSEEMWTSITSGLKTLKDNTFSTSLRAYCENYGNGRFAAVLSSMLAYCTNAESQWNLDGTQK